MDCTLFIPLLALRSDDLEVPERAALAAHLAACPSCRSRRARAEALEIQWRREAVRAQMPFVTPRRARWVWAAGLAAAAALAVWRGAAIPEPTPSVPARLAPEGRAPSSREAVRGGFEAVVERDVALGTAALVTFRAGTRARVDPDARAVRLEGGTLCADTRGESLRVEAAGILMESEDGVWSVETDASAGLAGWMRSAWAGTSGTVRVAVSRGRVVLTWDGRTETLAAGETASLRDGRLEKGRGVAWAPGGWVVLEAPATVRDGVVELGVPAGAYEIELMACRRDPRAEVALRLGAGGGAGPAVHEIPVGSAWKGTGWVRLRLAVGGGRCQASAGTVLLVEGSLVNLRRWPVSPGAAPGIRVWGGDLEIRGARWRAP